MRTLAWFSVGICLAYTVVATVYLVSQSYVRYRDIEAVAHRAQVAADAEDMLRYMTLFKANMEKHRMTEGHTALLFPSPKNDLALLYGSVKNIIDRLERIKGLSKSDTAYQVALDDLRGTIRELEAPTFGYVWVHNWLLFILYAIWIWPFVHLFRDDFGWV